MNALDPNGKDAWLVSRPIGATGNSANHMFVMIADCLGCPVKQIFSFAPSPEGQLVAHHREAPTGAGTTFADDWAAAGATERFGDFASLVDVTVAPIAATDADVIAAGEELTSRLGTVDNPNPNGMEYTLVPALGSGANSNSAAVWIERMAVTATAQRAGTAVPPLRLPPSHPNPNPGATNWRRLGDLCFTTRNQEPRC